MALSVRHSISAAQIAVYSPFLLIGIWLSIQHGFGRNAGWLYLILFSLIRILGSALDLATIDNPTTVGLYIGSATLQGIGLSALVLILLGLLSRALANIRASGKGVIEPVHLRLVQTLVMVSLILGIVGGSKAGSDFSQTFTLQITTESKASLALMIVAFAIVCAATVVLGVQMRHMDQSEKEIIPAVALSLPFVLVRLIYGCVGTLGGNSDFRTFSGNVWIFLGMSVIMEMIVVLICEATGLMLRKIPRGNYQTSSQDYQMKDGPEHQHRRHQHNGQTHGRV